MGTEREKVRDHDHARSTPCRQCINCSAQIRLAKFQERSLHHQLPFRRELRCDVPHRLIGRFHARSMAEHYESRHTWISEGCSPPCGLSSGKLTRRKSIYARPRLRPLLCVNSSRCKKMSTPKMSLSRMPVPPCSCTRFRNSSTSCCSLA